MLLLALTDGTKRPNWDVISHNSESFKLCGDNGRDSQSHQWSVDKEFHDTETNKVVLQPIAPKQKRPNVSHYYHDIPTEAHL